MHCDDSSIRSHLNRQENEVFRTVFKDNVLQEELWLELNDQCVALWSS